MRLGRRGANGHMPETDNIIPFNSSEALLEEARRERHRLLAQIEQSQRTIERSREIIARIDKVLSAVKK